jgi:twinkle protein
MKTWESLGINVRGKTSGNIKTQCPKCGKDKRDQDLSVNLTEKVYKCHKPTCEWHTGGTLIEKKAIEKAYTLPKFKNNTSLSDKVVSWFQGRGISQKTLTAANITNGKEYMPQKGAEVNTIQFNYFRDGQLVNVKFRTGDKCFKLVSGAELVLYNLDGIKGKAEIIITEGEIDALSFIEAGLDSVCSVPNGAAKGKANLEYLNNCYSYFENVKKVYLAVDNDEAGQALRDELARRLGKDICYLVEYPEGMKDANEVLKFKGVEGVRALIVNAKGLPLDDVLYLGMVREQMLHEFHNGRKRGTTTYFQTVDPCFTWKRGEVIIMGGIPNHGKTTMILQLMLLKSVFEGTKWGIFSPENFPPTEFYDDLVHTFIGKTTDPHYKDRQMTEEEYIRGMEFIEEHFFYVYPEEASPTPEYVNGKLKELILKHGIDGCLTDPFNQLDNDMGKFGRDDLYISHFLTNEKRFALKHDVYKIIIAHPSKLIKDKDGGYKVPDAYDLHGGSMWNNKADNILCTHRPNYWKDKFDTTVEFHSQKIKKQKLVGIPGTVTLTFDRASNRYRENNTSPFDQIGANQHVPPEERHPAQNMPWKGLPEPTEHEFENQREPNF